MYFNCPSVSSASFSRHCCFFRLIYDVGDVVLDRSFLNRLQLSITGKADRDHHSCAPANLAIQLAIQLPGVAWRHHQRLTTLQAYPTKVRLQSEQKAGLGVVCRGKRYHWPREAMSERAEKKKANNTNKKKKKKREGRCQKGEGQAKGQEPADYGYHWAWAGLLVTAKSTHQWGSGCPGPLLESRERKDRIADVNNSQLLSKEI